VKRYALLFLLGLAATLPYWGCYYDMDDEAVTVLGATRILAGELPYRDWETRHTPGSYFVAALYFLVGGSGPLGTRSLMGLISSLSGLVIQRCADRVGRGAVRYLPWVLWTCGGIYEKRHLNYHWFGTLSTLLTLYWLLRWVDDRSPRSALVAGGSAALSSWFLQSNGLSSLLMVVLVGARLRAPGMLRVGAAYLVTQVLLWIPWLAYASQVWQNHFSVLERHMQFNRQAYSWAFLSELAGSFRGIDLSQNLVHGLAAWSNFAHLAMQYGLFYVVVVLALVVAEWRRDRGQIAVTYACLAWALTTGYCQAPNYLSYACPAFQIALPCLLGPSFRGRQAVIVGWAGLEVLGWFFRAWSISLAYRYPVETRVGTYWSPEPSEAMQWNQLHGWIAEHCPAGSKVLAYPYFTRVYTLEKLANPIPSPILVPWLFSDPEFGHCAQVLEREKIAYILYRPLSIESIQSTYPSVPIEEFRQDYVRQSNRLLATYHRVWQNSSYQVLARP
jgi:hypothetical protein